MVTSMLSLIVTCYQSESELTSFFEWLAPVSPKFEKIVIVDDGSTDSTAMWLLHYSHVFENLEVIMRDENSGRPSLPRNLALACVPAESRVVFLDIDDRLPYGYVDFLLCAEVGDCFSGVKLVCDPHVFDPRARIPSFRRRIVTKGSLEFKNQIVFSGASLPAWYAKQVLFLDEPLEDWSYWRQIANIEGIRFVRLLDVPIAYNSVITLSPRKMKQLKRVYSQISWGMALYFIQTIRLKFEERSLRRKWCNTQVKL
jgi:glycosyltransferase involved in cell wall biosynthesis